MQRAIRWFALLVFAIAFLWALIEGPWWFDGEVLRNHRDLQAADGVVITGFRAALVAAVGGAVAVLTFLHTRRKDREETELARDGKATDRYMEAVKLLASSDSVVTRLGGIYALERIMYDSEKDRETAIEVLTGFIRAHVAVPAAVEDPEGRVADDLQIAIDVIGRRPDKGIHQHENILVAYKQDPNWRPMVTLNLQGARLSRVRLVKALLHQANLCGAELLHADFSYAKCVEAEFRGAQAQGADFSGADLSLADFSGADLSGADFSGARLLGAIFCMARLDGATFSDYANLNPRLFVGASMVSVKGLPVEQRASLKEFVVEID
ncbi:pentapeptide repeat-containing protein [Streptomyces sp. 769]|uniref:pentapeptide repeat-containing protein n=1 Tax=Streptomyces sp. 769 TaxID=1262452 RepID=UPI00131A7267|nr:pentapeptide repeat-containing protein [Streptomyces sp. 769]